MDTFTEKRTVKYTFNSYRGELLDSPQNGKIPEPWDVHVPQSQLFKNAIDKLTIPHTEQLMVCI